MSRKNLFDINLDNESGLIDADEFITRTLSQETKEKKSVLVDEYYKAFSKNMRRNASKRSLVIVAIVFSVGILLYVLNRCFSLLGWEELDFVWGVIILIFAIVARFIKFRSKKTDKPTKPSKNMLELDEELGKINKVIENELGVSDYARDIDVFLNFYDEKEGDLANDKAKIFEEGENLCIYYDGIVLSIKKASFEEIVKIDEEIYLDEWHKDVPYDRGRYMEYKIEKIDESNRGIYKDFRMKGYYSVRFSQEDKEYEILVPLYDIEPFCDILRISPKEIY